MAPRKFLEKLSNGKILENRALLYLVFFISIMYLLLLAASNNYYYAAAFILVGFLTSFFSKNMIVILFISITLTSIIQYGNKAGLEGLENEDKENLENHSSGSASASATASHTDETDDTEDDSDLVGKMSKKAVKDAKPSELSVEKKSSGAGAENFGGQDKQVVYTDDSDRELEKTEKMLLAQERMLERMNKYKPLLDTLQGITKNMVSFKT